MNRAREIFFVSNSVNELGGVASWQHRMATLFAERGHTVHVVGIVPPLVPHDIGEHPPYATTTLYDVHPPAPWRPHGVRGRANLAARRRQAVRAAGMRERAEKLTGLFLAAGPDAMIIVTQVWAMEWVALADTAGHSVIGMSHESFAFCRISSRFQRVQKYYADVDRMLVLTQEDADLWIRQGMNNVGFMPNPVPTAFGDPSPRTEPVVASVGRISHQKGIDMLLDAWAEVAPGHPDWRLRIYGTGETERAMDAMRAQCTRLGLDGSVEWMGRTGDVAGALRSSSLFVQSSRGEGFPMVLLEAMACAVPCVAFDCAPGVREIVRDGVDGLLAPPGNVRALAAHLGRLMADRELRDRMGELAGKNVQRFSPEEIARRWEELFSFLER